MQQITGPDAHTIIEGVSCLVGFAGFIILLMIKNNQATVKEELLSKQIETRDSLVRSQQEMREDMDGKHAENSKTIAVHIAEDKIQFAGIKSETGDIKLTLAKMDGKLDSISKRP